MQDMVSEFIEIWWKKNVKNKRCKKSLSCNKVVGLLLHEKNVTLAEAGDYSCNILYFHFFFFFFLNLFFCVAHRYSVSIPA